MNNFTRLGIPLALVLMVAKLSYVNYKSLIFLYNSDKLVDQVFSVIGAVAFSIVTVLVMQNKVVVWPKKVFPLFDALLVFLAFNLEISDQIINRTYDPIRLAETIVISVFAGAITYCLGLIEYKSGESKETKELAHEKDRANSLGKQLDSVKSELKEKQTGLNDINSYYAEMESNYDKLQSELIMAHSKIDVMQPDYIKYKLGRISRKKAENLTPDEKQFLKEHDNTLVA